MRGARHPPARVSGTPRPGGAIIGGPGRPGCGGRRLRGRTVGGTTPPEVDPVTPTGPIPSTPSPRTCCVDWRLSERTRCGPATSPTCRWGTTGRTWWPSWTGPVAWYWPGGCRTRCAPPSASKRWRKPCATTGRRTSSTRTRARSSPTGHGRIHLPAPGRCRPHSCSRLSPPKRANIHRPQPLPAGSPGRSVLPRARIPALNFSSAGDRHHSASTCVFCRVNFSSR